MKPLPLRLFQRSEQNATLASALAWTLGLTALTLLVALGCSLIGHLRLPRPDSWDVPRWAIWSSQVWHIRLFRLAAAAAVGSGLAAAGAAIQGLLRNPLAEPYVLGISSGAGIGVLLGGMIAVTLLPVWAAGPVLAAAGALITAGAVYAIARHHGRIDPYVLLLAGVIVNVFNGAIILTLLQFVKQEEMVYFIGWGMGQIPEHLWFTPAPLVIGWTVVAVGGAMLLLRAPALNMLALGDEVAASSGVAVEPLRREVFVVVSLITAASVAVAGPIGFVGLIVPHIGRMLLGPEHRRLLVFCLFVGAMFLMAADTFCRWIGEMSDHGELPVGVLTAFLGGPFFILLLRRRGRERSR